MTLTTKAAGASALVVASALGHEWPDGRILFENFNFSIARQKIGLVGRNGCGKSTLAKILADEIEVSHGSLQRRGLVLRLAQERDPLNPLPMSGGEAVRFRLKQILERDPDLLILDEPSNDLDEQGRRMVADVVRDWQGGVLVISHDPALLREVDEIWEIEGGKLVIYGGAWEFYREAKQLARDAQLREVDRLKREVKKTKRDSREKIDRQEKRSREGKKRAPSLGVSRMLMGMMKRNAEKTSARLRAREDKRNELTKDKFTEAHSQLVEEDEIRFDFPATAVPQGKRVLFFTFGKQEVTIEGPKRIHLKGVNGSGKTTLLKRIVIEREALVPHSFLDQNVAILDAKTTLLENIRDVSTCLDETEVRIRLARFLFPNSRVFEKCENLSGGEKMRAALLKALSNEPAPQLLLLDEPTNNLDISSRNRLASALDGYSGAMILVSHDIGFVERLDFDEIWELSEGRLKISRP